MSGRGFFSRLRILFCQYVLSTMVNVKGRSMQPKDPYAEFLESIEKLMARARTLGLYRTAKKLHKALDEGRSEQFEATPPSNRVTVKFKIGPVVEQP